MQAKREQWSGFAKTTRASRLVFLDESGVNINMARRYGRGKRGRRVVDHASLNTPKIHDHFLLDSSGWNHGVYDFSGWNNSGQIPELFERDSDFHPPARRYCGNGQSQDSPRPSGRRTAP